MSDARKSWSYQQAAAHVRRTHEPVCTYEDCDCPTGRRIDLGLPARHRWSFTVDHKVELQDGGDLTDPDNLTPMHWRCNSRKGVARQQARQQVNPSREW